MQGRESHLKIRASATFNIGLKFSYLLFDSQPCELSKVFMSSTKNPKQPEDDVLRPLNKDRSPKQPGRRTSKNWSCFFCFLFPLRFPMFSQLFCSPGCFLSQKVGKKNMFFSKTKIGTINLGSSIWGATDSFWTAGAWESSRLSPSDSSFMTALPA